MPSAKDRVPLLLARLADAYPDTGTALHFASPFQLLVATILSAQCTDKQVNKITPALFARFPTPQAMAAATVSQIIPFVKSTGFFRNKAKNIHATAMAILEHHGGEVPGTLEELVKLPGVGRKTANVVLGDGFGVTGITVDTHVGRLSRRLGLTRHRDPVKVEMVLNTLVPQAEWTRFSHRLILHGRAVCAARKPRCGECVLRDLCPRVGVVTSSRLQVVQSPAEPHAAGTTNATGSDPT
jgi:endonuclease-3